MLVWVSAHKTTPLLVHSMRLDKFIWLSVWVWVRVTRLGSVLWVLVCVWMWVYVLILGVGVAEPLDEVRVSVMGLGVGVDVGFQCGS